MEKECENILDRPGEAIAGDNVVRFPRLNAMASVALRQQEDFRLHTRSGLGLSGQASLTFYHPDGTLKSELWFDEDKAHRVDGPAYVRYHRDGSRREHWYRDHQRHRTNGPALVEWARDGSIRQARWWIGGTDVTTVAELFLAETDAHWPLDAADEITFIRRCFGERQDADQDARPPERVMSWGPILTALCLASVFWLPLFLTVALLWA